jgi:hypothetical protein
MKAPEKIYMAIEKEYGEIVLASIKRFNGYKLEEVFHSDPIGFRTWFEKVNDILEQTK